MAPNEIRAPPQCKMVLEILAVRELKRAVIPLTPAHDLTHLAAELLRFLRVCEVNHVVANMFVELVVCRIPSWLTPPLRQKSKNTHQNDPLSTTEDHAERNAPKSSYQCFRT